MTPATMLTKATARSPDLRRPHGAEADRFDDDALVMLRGIESVEARAVTLGSVMFRSAIFRFTIRASQRLPPHADQSTVKGGVPRVQWRGTAMDSFFRGPVQ
jgi:hypothetical protein